MSQPGGRVCGLPSRYRTYLRCSPFVCLADSVSILMWMVVLVAYQRLSFIEALGISLHRRFSENGALGVLAANGFETKGVQVLEKMTWLRWLWFALGTVPPAIKLLAMSGVGWVQVWGILFLSSWLLNESLVISATFNQDKFTISRTGAVSWPGYEQSTRSLGYKRVEKFLNFTDMVLAATALNAHAVLTNAVFRVVIGTTNPFPLFLIETLPRIPLTVSAFSASSNYRYRRYTSPGYQVIVTTAMLLGLSILRSIFRFNSFNLLLVLFGLFYLMLGNLAGNAVLFASISFTEFYVFFISFVVVPLFVLFLRFLARRYSTLGQNLLVMSRDANGDLKIDYGGSLALVFFLSTVFATLLWYCYAFDASGTSVPIWTGVFG